MRAAAVCYRRTSEGVEFLLVRTRNRQAWTFPKGHIEPGESPMHAAEREAMEEAVATGRIEPRPFTRYRYPVWEPSGLVGEVCVEAYLMEVEATGGQRAAERPTAWLEPEAAAKKLAAYRDLTYARELRRVIRKALARLQASPKPDG